MIPVSHEDLLIVVTAFFGVGMLSLAGIVAMLLRAIAISNEVARISRAVGALVIQEEEKTRALLREPR